MPKHLTIHSRVSALAFATIASAYSQRGLTTQSAIAAKALEDYAALLIEKQLAPAFTDVSAAANMLSQLELISKEQRSSILTALMKDSETLEMPFVPQKPGIAPLSLAEKIAQNLAKQREQE